MTVMGDWQQASPIPANIPKGFVTEWTVGDVQNWLSQSMQLPQYLEQFEDNEIAGDVLVHLDHDALKDLEVTSVGHRLYLLKQIYNLKIAHGVKFEKDDYVPISAPKADEDDEQPPPNITKQLRERDSKIIVLESEIKRLTDQMTRLNTDLIPVFKLAREKPLPTPELPTPPPAVTPTTSTGSSLARKFSTKKLFLGGSRKTADTTNQTMEISKPLMSPSHLNNLTERPESPRSPTKTTIPITPGLLPPNSSNPYCYTPSPEAPNNGSTVSLSTTSTYTNGGTGSYISSPVTPRRTEDTNGVTDGSATRNRSNSASAERRTEKDPVSAAVQAAKVSSSSRSRGRNRDVTNPMKSFRVNTDDPCWKVLPAAMKKYDVKGKEEDYRLYISYGDIERMLTANEKPLVIFQQLVKEGRNPVFMLRYAGKGTRPSDRDGPTISRTTSREEDPTTPKSAVPMSAPPGDAYGRYA